MIIYTAKVNRKRLLAIAIAIIIVLLAGIILLKGNGAQEPVNAETMAVSTKGIKTNQDRIAYIASLGYTVDTEPTTIKEVLIPQEFDETYNAYNEMQVTCGFDLAKYQGKRVMHYVYLVSEQQMNIELLVHKEMIIGGSIFSVASDGYMQGLTPKE